MTNRMVSSVESQRAIQYYYYFIEVQYGCCCCKVYVKHSPLQSAALPRQRWSGAKKKCAQGERDPLLAVARSLCTPPHHHSSGSFFFRRARSTRDHLPSAGPSRDSSRFNRPPCTAHSAHAVRTI